MLAAMKLFLVGVFCFYAFSVRCFFMGSSGSMPSYPAMVDHPKWAANLGEVFSKFVNPLTGLYLVPDFKYSGVDSNNKPIVNCYSDQCRACMSLTLHHMERTTRNVEFRRAIVDLKTALGLSDNYEPKMECRDRLFYSSPLSCKTTPVNERDLRELFYTIDSNERMCPMVPYTGGSSAKRIRRKDTPAAPENVTILACHRAGDHVLQYTGYVHLCGLCFGIRYLGEDVFPTYAEEIICNPKDMGCLNGHCVCDQSYLTATLANKTTRKLVVGRLQNIGIGCEPYLKEGSALRALLEL